MIGNTYVFWKDVLSEVETIACDLEHQCMAHPGVDFAHWVAERIRQLGRDMEPPTGPVIHEEKDKDTVEDGFGGCWSAWCPSCGKKSVEIVRAGKAQCSLCG